MSHTRALVFNFIWKISNTEKWREAQEPMAHMCNLSYSGGRHLEDRGSKPARTDGLQDPISKNPSQKKGWQRTHPANGRKKKIEK
jgi:hypothetical protein